VSVIVGRERERALLRTFVESRERPAACVIQGEAGIGKTVLWEEAVARMRSRSERVLTCRASEAETTLAFSGLADLLADVATGILPRLPPPQRHALAVALLLETPAGAPPDERAIGAALLASLQQLAGKGGVVVAVDDVQWLDPASASALAFAARRLDDAPVALLLAWRTSGDEPLPLELSRVFPDGRLSRLVVGPLSLGALHRLLRARLDVSFPRPLLRRIHEAAGGNPFYALELARVLGEQSGRFPPGEPLPVPATLHELVRDRIATQTAAVRETLAAVALAASPSVAIVETALGPSAAIDEAIEAGLLRLDGPRLELTHPLLGPGALAAVGPPRRRAMHRILATVVEDPEARARHLAAAADGPSSEVAQALEDAACAAAARGATDAAADLAELALDLTPVEAERERVRRQLAAGDYSIRCGAMPRARELLQATIERLPPGRDRAQALFGLASTEESGFDVNVRLLEQALAEADGDEALQADIEHVLGVAYYLLGDTERGYAHDRAAVERARRTGDPVLLVRCLASLAHFETYSGDLTTGLLEEALELEQQLDGLPDYYDSPSAVMGLRLMYADRVAEGRPYMEHAYRQALEAGDEHARAGLLLHLSELEHRAGRWPHAREHAEEGLQLSEQSDYPQARSALLYCRANVDAHLGRLEAARADAEEGLAMARASGDEIFAIQNLAVLGFVEVSAGDYAAAAELLRDLPRRLVERGEREPTTYAVVPNASEALIHLGDVEAAVEGLEWLERQGEAFDAPTALAQAARCRGLLAAARGDQAEAAEQYERALVEHERMASPFERGRTLLAYGALLRRARQKRAARERLEEALGIFEQLGAEVWAERTRAELARLGGRRPAGQKLTPTELRVAQLVAEGRSNKEVAAALVVSPRTVEDHLSRIYQKLGVRSRTQLAALIKVP
jgi:DNA-binding CsgD family transcriptional regulator